MSYSLDPKNLNEDGFLDIRLKEVVGTEHSALMNEVMYEQPPDRNKFIDAIK